MGLLKRIGFYLGGFALGLIVLAFIFKGKETQFCYSPNCRVLKNIRSKKIVFENDTKQDSTEIGLILKKGDVIFSKSNTESEPCKTYVIEKETENTNFEIKVKNCDSIAFVSYFKKSG